MRQGRPWAARQKLALQPAARPGISTHLTPPKSLAANAYPAERGVLVKGTETTVVARRPLDAFSRNVGLYGGREKLAMHLSQQLERLPHQRIARAHLGFEGIVSCHEVMD